VGVREAKEIEVKPCLMKKLIWTTKEIALALNTSIGTVRRWIQTDELLARKKPGTRAYVIFDEDLTDFLKRHYKPGKFKRYNSKTNIGVPVA